MRRTPRAAAWFSRNRADLYAHTPMDYADGALVLLAHDLGELRVATIDVGDFSAYRTEGKRVLRMVF